MDQLWQDLRYAVRMLAKNPGFTLVAVLTLALGIGANTAIFNVLDAVLLRSLPVPHPERLATLTNPEAHGTNFGSETGNRSLLSYAEFQYLRDHNQVFTSLFAADSSLPELEITITPSSIAAHPAKQTARVRLVTGTYFDTLGIAPAAGRTFSSEADRTVGSAPVAVISYAFWNERFQRAPAALGQIIQIRATAFEIVGVAPPGFLGETVGEAVDIWLPATMQRAVYPGADLLSASARGLINQYEWLQVIGRLKPRVTLAQAKASINVTFQSLLQAEVTTLSADDRRDALTQQIDLQSGAHGASTVSIGFGQPLQLMMVLVSLVLLIACANVANLLLARGAARQKEFGMRLALGAGRWRLMRQLLTESLLLALLGGVLGIALAQWADASLLHLFSAQAGSGVIQLKLQPDARILFFSFGLAMLTAILFGLAPSLLVTRCDMSPILKSATTPSSGQSGLRLPVGKLLVVVQVAVSLILLVAAGLSVRSLEKLSRVSLGYNREKLLLFRVDPTAAGYQGSSVVQVYGQLRDKISAIPGVRAVTLSHNGLFSHSESRDPITVDGYAPKPGEDMNSRFDHVGPGYFSALGIPVLMGRELGNQDAAKGPHLVVINQAFARRFFPNTNPIGKRISDTYPGNPAEMQVVGLVADAKYNSLRERLNPRVYASIFNPMWDQHAAVYEVRTFADPVSVSAALREAVHDTNAAFAPIEIHTMAGLVDESLRTDRFIEKLSGAFGTLALVLASIGLYGVMAYTVARHTRDIGIRLALGAEPGNVLRQVLRETLALVLLGVLVGVPIAVAGGYFARSILYDLGVADPLAIGFAALTLASVAALAGFVPARRAARVDPMVALRYE